MRLAAGILPPARLVVITGPVGGGKSTLAGHLAVALRRRGHGVAVVDLDTVYLMVRQEDGFGNRAAWATARNAAAAIADTCFGRGMGTVIVEGGFLSALELSELRDHLRSSVTLHFFTLMVSAQNALHRAQHDPDPNRVASRLEPVQAALYAEFEADLPYLRTASQIIEGNSSDPTTLAETLAHAILEPGPL